MKLLLVSLLVIFVVASEAKNHEQGHKDGEWRYDDQDDWPGKCQEGDAQSPIAITEDVEHVEWGPLKMTDDRGQMKLGRVMIKNTGHGFAITSEDFKHCMLHEGGLNGKYILDHFHFHWDQQTMEGSEHVINGDTYDLEGHFVYYHSKFQNLKHAIGSDYADALAVVGVMYNQDAYSRPYHFKELSSMLAHVAYKDHEDHEDHEDHSAKPTMESNTTMKYPNKTMKYPPTTMKYDDKPTMESNTMEMWKESDALQNHYLSDFLPDDMEHFYRYDGSLTTPGCNQVVKWTVMDPGSRGEGLMYIGVEDLKHFKAFRDNHGKVMSNHRDTQKLNGRRVYHNMKKEVEVGGAANQKPVFAMLFIAVCIGKLFT